MYYLLYKEMSFLVTLASMSFFQKICHNLDCFLRVGYKNDVKKAKRMGTHVFMQASDCVINYLYKNKFLLSSLQSVILFYTLTSKNAIFICLGEISFFFLGYKVGKLIFFSGLCLNFILYK